jgi:aminopeptidase N
MIIKKMIKSLLLLFLLGLSVSLSAQRNFYKNYTFTAADTLRGMLRPERTCFDVTYYALDLKIDIDQKFIAGTVDIVYHTIADFETLQLDLYQNMQIQQITWQGNPLKYERRHDAIFVYFPTLQKKGTKGKIQVKYEGNPTVAVRAPWDGGFVWSKDKNGKPWVGVACEGDGASLWWPCKDHLSDEPDSVSIKLTVPSDLMVVANGNLRKKTVKDKEWTQYEWFVSYPINTYNVTLNIADYVNFKETYTNKNGEALELDYYVLSYNLEKAKKHFKQTHEVVACFEEYFGKYPFWKDGIGFVETPYLGMEHQGAIAYGNQYMRGYLGGMIPKDMNWDYIIVHEYGHEYFGNSVSAKDIAEMWIHESFTTYMEALYVECKYSYADAIRYLQGQRPYIRNQEPIVGPLEVNFSRWSGSDHYYKGAWMLHSLRHAINNEDLWLGLLKSIHQKFAYQTTTTQEIIAFINEYMKKDFTPFFQQYLYHAKLPTFEYSIKQQGKQLKLRYRWSTPVSDFDMPLFVGKQDNYQMIYPTTQWQEMTLRQLTINEFKVATELFLLEVKAL